jgi:uncharacterized protein (TIGR03435 family)
MTVRGLLAFAYRTPDRPALMAEQILGGPGWIDTDRFNIEGKPEGGASKDEMQVMVQSLLEDRFQLKLHYETRELPVFNLLLASPKLKLSADQTSPTQPPDRGTLSMTGSSSGTTIKGNAVPISALIDMLHTAAGRPVLDKTGLKGLFDINLLFSQSGPTAATPAGVSETPLASDPSGPSILSAIQELGLKLESAKAPIEVLVIDSVQKPTEN